MKKCGKKQFLLKDLKISSHQYLKSQAAPPENGPREKNNKAANGGVFKVGDLQLARPDEDKRDGENDDDHIDDGEDGDVGAMVMLGKKEEDFT